MIRGEILAFEIFLVNLSEVTSSELKLSGRGEKKKFVALTTYVYV